MFIFFIMLCAIAIVDHLLYFGWNRPYFGSGIMLRRRLLTIDPNQFRGLESIVGGLPILIHRFGPHEIGFRDKVLVGWFSRTPFYHGMITYDADRKQARVEMLANWFPVLFFPIFIGFGLIELRFPIGIIFGLAGIVIFIACFAIWNTLFDKMYRDLLNKISNPGTVGE